MVAVRMMQAAIDEIVDVITMRHRLVPATGTMHMVGLVAGGAMLGRATVRIALRHFDHVLVDMIDVRMMQVSVMQIVHVIAVAHGDVSAARAVLMRVVLVMGQSASRHERPPCLAGNGTNPK